MRLRYLHLQRFSFVLCLGLAALMSSGAAFSHGGGQTAGDLAASIGDYEKQVAALIATTDQIAADYAAGESVGDQLESLTDAWDDSPYYEAIETHAMPLYSPIWSALGGMKNAVKNDAPAGEVRQRSRQVAGALHQGLGALKLAAARADKSAAASDAGHGDKASDRSTLAIIQANLDKVLERYKDGQAAKAQKLIDRTYLQRFEGIEGPLIEQDAELVESLEIAFNATLPQLIEKGASTDKVAAQIKTMKDKLDRAKKLLEQAAEEQSSVF